MLSFFPLDVLDEIWDLIESVSEGFLTYSLITSLKSVRKRRQQLHARDVRGLTAFCFCPLKEEKVNKSCFPSILRCKLCFHTFQDPINTLGCLELTLNH